MDFVTEEDDLEKFSPSSDRRPFEVILRGGNPWGFTLSGGEEQDSPLHISQIDDKSPAGNSALCVGDIVFSVNGISCGSCSAGRQLIDSAFRTLTLKVLRGGWEPRRVPLGQASSPVSGPPEARQRPAESTPKSRVAHDDSALYTHSKSCQQSRPAMKPGRRRGDSFHVSKTKHVPSSTISDSPWTRGVSNSRPGPLASPRASYPETHEHQRQLTVHGRRYSEAHSQLRSEGHMVASKSSPNLKKAESQGSLLQEKDLISAPVKSVKSSPNIPEEVEKESWPYVGRSPLREQKVLTRSAQDYGWSAFTERLGAVGEPSKKSKIYSEDMYTADMIAGNEAKVLPSQALHKYEADYENIGLLGTAPLQSEKISEIDDIEDVSDSEAPQVPPRPSCVDPENPNFFPPAPPVRDPSSLKHIRVNQNHEKYPSWPVTQPNIVAGQSQPINVRAQSWTDHTNTGKEFPTKQRLAYTPGLRPLPEKSPPSSETKGDDSGKARNSSDPGFKSEFVYGKYGRVEQRKKGDNSRRFEEFYHNSKPGYPPPKLDSDGHNYGDKEYSAPSPPERDMAGIDQQMLSQALGTMSDKRTFTGLPPHHPHRHPQPQEGHGKHLHSAHQQGSQPSPALGPGAGNKGVFASRFHQAPMESKRPGALSMPSVSSPPDQARHVDTATSPLKTPQEPQSGPGEFRGSLSLPSSMSMQEKETVPSTTASRLAGKAYIVRQTPYYNTSTQTDMQSYAVKMASPNAKLNNVEIQVGDFGGQTSPRKDFEEKSIQARMSQEFQPADLDASQERQVDDGQRKTYFQYSFEGIQSIKDKYATDEDGALVQELPNVFTPFSKGSDEQASIMRKLSEEFYGNKLGLTAEKRHSSASSQEHSPKFTDSSSTLFHSGTMSQAESYSSIIIHPSESSAPFGRDDFGSQLSIADSKQDSLASSSKSSLRDLTPRGRGSFDSSISSPSLMPQSLQESKKYGSLSSFYHQRETSAPTLSHFPNHSQESLHSVQSSISVDSKWRQRGSHRSSTSSVSESSQPTSSLCSWTSGSTHYSGGHREPLAGAVPVQEPHAKMISTHHPRLDSVDSVFNEDNLPEPRERTVSSKNDDSGMLNKRISMRMAYGTYDDSERLLSAGRKETVIKGRNPTADGNYKQKLRPSSTSEAKLLGQIREVNEGDISSGREGQSQRNLDSYTRLHGASDSRSRHDSWLEEVEKRTGYMKKPFPEQVLEVHDRNDRTYQSYARPQRGFDGSIDSGVGSEVSARMDYFPACSGSADASDLKKQKQETVENFLHGAGKLPDSLHESVSNLHSPRSESVSDLISKTNENLAKMADSFRRSSSSSSRNSSSDYVEMNRQDRSRKETEWSRLRSSGSFLYGSDTTERPSNRSSLSSENPYEDISVFSTTPPHGSAVNIVKDLDASTRGGKHASKADDMSTMDSSVLASSTYQNLTSSLQRRPPPPPPRTPSPEPLAPPALPPRGFPQSSDAAPAPAKDEGGGEEARRCVKSLVNQWESNSPREDAYAAQLRKQAVKLSGQRGPAGGAVPSSMSLIHSRTQMGISTSYKREPMVAQEATHPAQGSTSRQSASPASFAPLSSMEVPEASSASETSASPSLSFRVKDANHPAFSERDSKSLSCAVAQVPEKTRVPSSGEQHTPSHKTDGSAPKGDMLTPRDRSRSDAQQNEASVSASPLESTRERSASDTRVFSQTEKAKDDRMPTFCQRQLDISPSQKVGEHTVVVDPRDLPPPPPELLNDSNSSPAKELLGDDRYADDSYGAYKNRSSRQVGIYKRSSSAAVIRQDSGDRSEGTDASTSFSDRRLGSQSWNSESHLPTGSRHDTFRSGAVSGGGGLGDSGPPDRPLAPDRPGNVPAFKADSSPAGRGVTKVTGGPQPLQPRHPHPRTQSPQSRAQTAKSGNSNATSSAFAAQPYAATPQFQSKGWPDEGHRQVGGGAAVGAMVTAASSQQPQQQQNRPADYPSKLERKGSFTSGTTATSAAPSPSRMASPSHRWANVVPFEATHHVSASAGDSANSRRTGVGEQGGAAHIAAHHSDPSSPSHAPNSSATPHTDSISARAHSERTRPGEVSDKLVITTKPDSRADEVSPPLPTREANHQKNVSGTGNSCRTVPAAVCSRRESAPLPPVPIPRFSARESPRRQSEGSFLAARQEADRGGEATARGGGEDKAAIHGRQPSQEELECDQKVLELAREVADSEKKLSDVLSADAGSTRMKYIQPLFADLDGSLKRSAPPSPSPVTQSPSPFRSRSPSHPQNVAAVADEENKVVDEGQKKNSLPREYFVSANKAVLQMEWRKNEEASKDLTRNIQDSDALIKQKEELIEKLYKKLEALKEERRNLQEEIAENNGLGKRVRETVEAKCSSASDKFRSVVDDLEKIVRLLLNLSGQLARAENAVQALSENADSKLKKMTLDKREKLQVRHEEAQQLKEDIDKRTEVVSSVLQQSLTSKEHSDYTYFIKMKSKLTIDLQELEDKITLGEEQIQELKKSIPDKISSPGDCSLAPSSPSLSPISSPIPS